MVSSRRGWHLFQTAAVPGVRCLLVALEAESYDSRSFNPRASRLFAAWAKKRAAAIGAAAFKRVKFFGWLRGASQPRLKVERAAVGGISQIPALGSPPPLQLALAEQTLLHGRLGVGGASP